MGKHAWVPGIVTIGCIWVAITLFSVPTPEQHIASAAELDTPYPIITLEATEATVTETATPSATDTRTPTKPSTETATATAEPQPNVPQQDTLTAPTTAPETATPPPVGASAAAPVLQCRPYTTYVFTGVTEPYTQLLLKFGDRVVGGSISDANGRFSVPLNMGLEVAGEHTIAIVARDTGIVIATTPCTVP